MKTPKLITVLIADDHPLIRQGLCALLDRDSEISVVGEARNGQEAVEMAHELRPNVVLMDISMPILNGLEATRQIIAEKPTSKIVIFSAHVGNEYSDRAREAGAVAYVAKLMSAEALTWVIHEVAMGRKLRDPVGFAKSAYEEGGDSARSGPPKSKSRRLTFRESKVLGLMAEGLPKRQVAAKLRISSSSVEKHFGALMAKLGVPSVAGLVAYASAFDFVENDVELTIT
jgi:DNA-binding NarL/FixJ family response regulator